MKRIALALAGGTLLATLTAVPAASPAAATHLPYGACSPTEGGFALNELRAAGSYRTAGGVTLAGTRYLPSWARDTRTHITVRGTYPTASGPVSYTRRFYDVGAATAYSTPRNASRPVASVHFDRSTGLKDYYCSFRLAGPT